MLVIRNILCFSITIFLCSVLFEVDAQEIATKIKKFQLGLTFSINLSNVDLIGGDTTSSQKGFVISVTAIGEVAPDKYVKRSTAKAGDLICVSGDLGGAFLGLTLLEREKKKSIFLRVK